MARLTWRRLGAVAFGLGFLSWAINVLVLDSGLTPLAVPPTIPVAVLVLAGVTLWLAWGVREYRAGRRPGFDRFRAARTAMFSQAAALTGAALLGAYGGYALALANDWGHPPRRALAVAALVTAVAAAVLLACGWLAERWCSASSGDGGPGGVASKSPGVAPEVA